MRVGVGELDGDRADLEAQWDGLVAETGGAGIGLLALPEMPFSRWLAASPEVDARAWERAVDDHDRWCERLGELDAEVVVTTRPIIDGGIRFNEGIVWTRPDGIVGRRRKTFLPDEPGFYEATRTRPRGLPADADTPGRARTDDLHRGVVPGVRA